MIPLEKLANVSPDAGLWSALEKMGREGVNQLPVVDGNRIIGILSREDVVQYLHGLQALHAR
jgi:CBS domain-containing protein